MKKIKILLLVLAVAIGTANAQIIGETDAISIPDYQINFEQHFNSARSLGNPYPENPCTQDNYECGYLYGLHVGYEDGLNNANNCDYYEQWIADELENTSFEFLSGYYDGWWKTYDEGYNDRISEKASTCSENEVFDEFLCQCICVKRPYFFDGDGDNYYDFDVTFKYQCYPPSSSWKLETEFYGIDCNDSNPNIWKYNDCGLCTADDGKTNWYYDFDGDGYYGQTKQSCSKPTDGNNSKWSRYSGNGIDCNDDDKLANIEKTWYYFGDADNYYGETRVSCIRPDDYSSAKWRIEPGLGWDCDDSDSDIIGQATWYYDFDGDGYYSQSKTICGTPTSGELSRWSRQPGSGGNDCDDNNAEIHEKDACGKCGGDGSPMIIYLDVDGDGYHSMELYECCGTSCDPNPQRLTSFSKSLLIEVGYPAEIFDGEWVAFDSDVVDENGCHGSLLDVITETGYHPDHEEICITHTKHLESPYAEIMAESIPDNTGDFYGHLLADLENDFYTLAWGQFYPGDASNFWNGYGVEKTLGKDCNDLDPSTKANGDWYADRDEDGYHDPSVDPITGTCSPPDDGWILLANSFGVDCDDEDQFANEPTTWYFDGDSDNYYGESSVSCENPAKGTPDESLWQTDMGHGVDCDDTDDDATIVKIWYKDEDDDGFYSTSISACVNPGTDLGERDFWKTDEGNGLDCDDKSPDKSTLNACGECGGSDEPVLYYVDLDGDGYHSVVKEVDCGLPTFDGNLVANSNFPESLIPEAVLIGDESARTEGTGDCSYTDVPNTIEQFKYCEYANEFTFPESLLTFHSLGLDCDDLDPTVLADGEWYPDGDGDGYHDPVAPVNSCSPPNPSTYILLANSLGEDCNDSDPTTNKSYTWYYDADGDGYYIDTQENCAPPGFGWSITSGIGPDIDDSDPFNPTLARSDQQFVIPSLMKSVTGESGEALISYGGSAYAPEDISLVYRGVTFSYDQLVFDRVSPTVRLTPDQLVIGEQAVLLGAELVIDEAATAAAAARIQSEGVPETWEKTKDEWHQEVIDNNEGYHHTWGDVYLENEQLEGYYSELFDAEQFENFKVHYDTYAPGFAIQFVTTTEEVVMVDNKATKVVTPIVNETIGQGPPQLIITATRTAQGVAKVVISTHEESFEATDEELQSVGWKDENNQWVHPNGEELYKRQLDRLRTMRDLMAGLISMEYQSVSDSQTSSDGGLHLPGETFPAYGYNGMGVLSKWTEFFLMADHLAHNFALPQGTWDPDAPDDGYNRWRFKTAPSIAGVTDGFLVEIEEAVEAVEMIYSAFNGTLWGQMKEMWQNFDFDEQLDGMISAFTDEFSELSGDQGPHKQYHSVGKLTVRTVISVYAVWKAGHKIAQKLANGESLNPVKNFNRRLDHFKDVFAATINKTQEFARLSKDLKLKLMDDLAASVDDALGAAMSKNSGLIDNWKYLDEAGVDNSIRKSVDCVGDIDAVEDALEVIPKSKPTWAEIKVLFKRGNDFNRKARDKYDYNEIVLENGKRLDTYVPGEKIISRKATDIDNIQESTWRKYCSELVTKYKKGTGVNSSKLDGEPPLSGDYFLEIPATNQTASKLADFRRIAQDDFGIKDIIFLAE